MEVTETIKLVQTRKETTAKIMLSDYPSTPNSNVWRPIVEDDLNRFKSALINAKNVKISKVMSFLFATDDKNSKQEFFEFVIRNDGKYWWNMDDYFIIAYCAYKNDFNTLKLIYNTIDTSKYDVLKKIIDQESKWVCKFANNQRQFAIDYDKTKALQNIQFWTCVFGANIAMLDKKSWSHKKQKHKKKKHMQTYK